MDVRRHWSELRKHLTPERIAAFRSKVDERGPDECWPWIGSLNQYGYGMFSLMSGSGPINSHRIAYGLANGGIPRSLHILHICDTRDCCNPRHLFAGTHQQNMDDMRAKGRASWQNKGACRECGTETSVKNLTLCASCRAFYWAPIIAAREEARLAAREARKIERRRERSGCAFPESHDELLALLGGDRRRTEAVERYFGLYDRDPQTLQEIGDLIGLSRERIRQYKVGVLAKLRLGSVNWKYCRQFSHESDIRKLEAERIALSYRGVA